MATRIFGRALLAGAGGAAFLAGISSSLASTFAYESFGEYKSLEQDAGLQGRVCPNGFGGNPIGGQAIPDATSGIFNWNSGNAWSSNRVANGDLSYGSLITGGGKHFEAYAGGMNVRAIMDLADFAGLTGTGTYGNAIGATGNTIYLSFLFRIDGSITANSQAVFQFQEETAANTFGSRFDVGQSWNSGSIAAQGTTLSASVDNNVHMVVMSVTYNGTMTDSTDQVRLWYDPNLALSETQAATQNYTRNMTFSHLNFNGQGTSSNTMTKLSFDELRIGTSWADVAPVPEPATLALGATIGSLLLARRRS